MTAIDDKWFQIQWIGPAVDEGGGSGEMDLGDGRGRARDYANGSIYWTPQTGAHEVHGDIRVRWAQDGGHKGFLGYPETDETGTPDGVGRYNHFEHGSIYWTQQTGAHEVHGDIRQLWASMGWERSYLGYPTTDEHNDAAAQGGRRSEFQHGFISWTPSGGAKAQRTVAFDDNA